jgi:ABC-type transport system involved in cytochrome c biogenesis permease subunit
VPNRRHLHEAADLLHYWYIHVGSILLLAGIVTGSMWAASSWGRYWGWDPKEVWSLVAFLGYMAILHVRVDHERVPGWARLVAVGLAVAVFALLLANLTPLTGVKLLAFAAAAFAVILFVMARGPFATALKSTLAFWLIIMTYVGVNYVLGIGLHSYGFGTGAVVRYLFLVGGIDLALIALCAIVYLARRPSPALVARGVPAADSATR